MWGGAWACMRAGEKRSDGGKVRRMQQGRRVKKGM